jgi:DNA polymerase-3 subunit gamma/tau
LITEGHSPTHFARQMVRFLRNAVVAKVAGGDSSLLQISSDERQRVARVAALFSEEDLARHLQIMLRTHGELGYRQEQRFHLELGLLKMAHAQKLLPIEQLLSEAAAPGTGARVPGRPSVVPDSRKSETAPAGRPNYVSPFAADSARKSKLSAEETPVRAVGMPNVPVVMGTAAPVAAVQPEGWEEPGISQAPTGQARDLRNAVLNALENAGNRMLSSMLDTGDWQVEDNDLVIKVPSSSTVIDMSLGADARRLIVATASGVLGRPVKLKVIPGAAVQTAPPSRPSSNGGGRSRVEQDPIVRRMKEKFKAEIRTVIDYREKR